MSTLWEVTKKTQDELNSMAAWELIEHVNLCYDEVDRLNKIQEHQRIKQHAQNNSETNEEKVRLFHEVMDQPAPLKPVYVIDSALAELRYTLIQEELHELSETEEHDIANIARELCDLLYVVYGTGVAFGIWLEPIFNIIHEANMQKTTGPVRDDGKRMKPEGWKFPWEAVQKEIERQRR